MKSTRSMAKFAGVPLISGNGTANGSSFTLCVWLFLAIFSDPRVHATGALTIHSDPQKGEVLARSSFSEILYLDSDSVPLTDPTFLFDSPTYKQHGAVLWPDFNRDAGAS